ncbi:MAG: VOC family protein [Acidobacteriota bacterium]|jgi:catechol 2,3-dioxygenase-like lactoylglutathione lyase family enzyme|nr:VOC family protein [Acidobacteriota bacterium]
MKMLLASVVAFLVALPAHGQLATSNSAGVTFGHLHLNVADIEVHKKLWVEHFGGVVVQKGPLTTVRLPGTLIVLSKRVPSGDQEGSVLDHLGFKVPNLKEFLEGWRAAGYEVMREFTGVEDAPNAYLLAPDQVKIELQEETTLPVKAAAYHIHFFTNQYVELMDWYSGLFLLEPRARGLLRYTADAPGMNLSFSNSRTGRVATRGRSLDHIGFEVDDLEAFVKMLEARGIIFDVPYREVPSIELKIAFFTDPSGVYIELTEGFDKY